MAENNILVVDHDKITLDSLCNFLSTEGFNLSSAETAAEAMAKLKKQAFSLVITEINLPDGDGFELLNNIKKYHPQSVVIVITGYGSIESAVRSIKLGANDYLTKPIIDDELRLAVGKAIKQQSLISENERLRLELQQKYSLENILSHDYKMARIFDLINASSKYFGEREISERIPDIKVFLPCKSKSSGVIAKADFFIGGNSYLIPFFKVRSFHSPLLNKSSILPPASVIIMLPSEKSSIISL